ncbi:MAG: glycoside hydrolase family 19 protein [Candidatus Omnitrophota bacterium]
MGLLTKERLTFIMPKTNSDIWVDVLNAALARFSIDVPARAAAFLAQVAHESGELNRLVENLNYSAQRLMQIWPKHFPTLEIAQQYEKNPEKLANNIYSNRLGNGDETSGDGWKYRGRGLIQLTGKSNYMMADKVLNANLVGAPDLVAQPEFASLTAAHFWKSNGLNELADKNDDNNFIQITKKINGGTVGLDERKAYWTKARQVLS